MRDVIKTHNEVLHFNDISMRNSQESRGETSIQK